MTKKKNGNGLLNSRKWRATLLGLCAILALYTTTLISLDRADPSFNRELGGLLDFPIGAVVTLLSAFMGIHSYSEKKNE